ncbi:adenosylcobinamide-phosphate synthase [Inhella inkyongensis]|uniref:Cobalamin biosynthesis protein CobD n=1 Tax=Inhella inkyongensis TaxID=392593 RepID=A0A840S564_9BURK|nr:adenosylcobinamide-phosphate synthase CbiB [Inhella inkyongensis]MBB5204843.1 adenosylcobinamide-phosphate synthase [Inhella inkyongensis]
MKLAPEVLAATLALTWALDQFVPEPPNRFHPVAWLGALVGPIGRWLCARPAALALIGGTLVWWLLALALILFGGLLTLAEQLYLPSWAEAIALALLLKPCLAGRMLHDEVAAVEAALGRSLMEGRQQVARLCSRDVNQLDAPAVRETALETLAENFNDSLVAPLFWFAVAGLPGALVYRMANTLDAMWGYRGRWEWAGKWAAKADDGLSAIPARLAALLLAPAQALRPLRLWRTARLTPSPNGGWPMGALALQLGVRLGKPGVYVLNAEGRVAQAADTERALRRYRLAALATWMGAVALAWGLTR